MSEKINYQIIEAGPEWADDYRSFCRVAYAEAYARPDLGINKERFSEKVFNSQRVVKYFADAFNNNHNHQAWLAITGNNILGGVVAVREKTFCEIGTFYVNPQNKGEGIGHALFQKVLQFAGDLPIQLDVLKYMQPTIDIYKHWGFEIDPSKGEVEYEWIEWPEKSLQTYRGVYMVRPGKKAA